MKKLFFSFFVLIIFLLPVLLAAGDVEKEYNQALLNIKNEKYSDAYLALKEIDADSPGYKDIYYNLGLCAEKLNYTDEAFKYFNKGLEQIKNVQSAPGSDYDFVGFDFREKYTSEKIDTQALLRLAKVYIDQGLYDLAEDYATRALNFFKTDPRVYLYLGISEFKKGRTDEALLNLKKAIYFDNTLADAYYYAGLIRETHGKDKLAEANFRLAVKNNPLLADAYIKLGLIYEKRNQDTRALNTFSVLLKKSPKNLDALTNIGRISLKMGDYLKGMDYLTQARKNLGNERIIDNLFTRYSLNIADSLYAASRFDEALYFYQMAYQYKQTPRALFNTAKIYMAQHRPQKALDAVMPIIETYNKPQFFSLLGDIYMALNMKNRAIAAFSRYIKFKPRDTDTYFKLARLYSLAGDDKKRINSYKNVLKYDKKDTTALLALGNYFYNHRQLQKAKNYFYPLVISGYKNDVVYYRMSKILFAAKNYSGALSYIRRALKMTQSTDYLFLEYQIYSELSNYVKAKESLNAILKLDPSYFPALYNIGLLYFDLRDYNKGLRYLKKAEKSGSAPDLQYYIAMSYFYLKKYNPAIERLLKINDTGQYNDVLFKSYFNLANMKFKKKQYFARNGAVKLYMESMKYLKKERNRARIYFQLGLIYAYQNFDDSAAKYFKMSFKADEDFYAPYYNLGVLYEAKGEYDTAIMFYKKIMKYEPTNANTIVNIGNSYAKLKRYGEALNWYERGLAVRPKSSGIKYNIVNTLINLGRLRPAQKMLNSLPHGAQYYELQGDIFYENKSYVKSIAMYKRAAALAPKDAKVYNKIGAAFVAGNYADSGIAFFKRVLASNKQDNIYMEYALLLEHKKLYDAAAKIYEDLLAHNPKNIEIYIQLAAIYFDQKKYTVAEKYADQGLTRAPANTDLQRMKELLNKLKK